MRIWLLTYEVVPDANNTHFGAVEGAFVNCWIKAESESEAADIACHQLASEL